MTGNSNKLSPKSNLIETLQREGFLRSELVKQALLQIRREDFVWTGFQGEAYYDEPLPLGETGQTISAPHMVAIMLEEAELNEGLKVLEVGAGSGYNAALIAQIVTAGRTRLPSESLVTTIEKNPKLVEFARANIQRSGLGKFVNVVEGDGSLGYPQRSDVELYDRIIVTAGASVIPPYLTKQLKVGGLLLMPVGHAHFQNLVKLRKLQNPEGKIELREQKLMPVMFVPLIGEGAETS
jgi:protein-L-isoaspartate(D-aspartate) O-methyltransferase